MSHEFPDRLLNWAGHRSGGVRRFFHEESGRPSGELIRTKLLDRLSGWAREILAGDTSIRVVILVGGPGNGKTEAIEECVRKLDEYSSAKGKLIGSIAKNFKAGSGKAVPRLASSSFIVENGRVVTLQIVQDASVADAGVPDVTASSLFLRDIEAVVNFSSKDTVYLACVNRGVLDEAFAESVDSDSDLARLLLTKIISSVGLTSDAPQAWPLEGFPHVAVWPMDMESSLVADDGQRSAAGQLLSIATDERRWPKFESCPAGHQCPHCTSRRLLALPSTAEALLRVLRWYELASGKRWNFRDLGSLISFILAGSTERQDDELAGPCEQAARLIKIDPTRSPIAKSAVVPFLLMDAQYQHAIFGKWPSSIGKSLRRDVRELGLETDRCLMGLVNFLSGHRRRSLPSTLEPLLDNLCDVLDPALADPDHEIRVSPHVTIKFRDVDARFSQSIFEGLKPIENLDLLTPIELKVLRDLAFVDGKLSTDSYRKPAVAFRVQQQIREFCCRVVRRSIGTRFGFTKDANTLDRFQQVVAGDRTLIHDVVKQVENLLNENEHFTTSLNTTFGEPLPPPARRVMLTTTKQKVRPQHNTRPGRPLPTLCFLVVGSGSSQQSIPLTYDLFKSVTELGRGMLVATMPRTVVALLDATRARLSGQIVRDEESLEGAEFRLGVRPEFIAREFDAFVVRKVP